MYHLAWTPILLFLYPRHRELTFSFIIPPSKGLEFYFPNRELAEQVKPNQTAERRCSHRLRSTWQHFTAHGNVNPHILCLLRGVKLGMGIRHRVEYVWRFTAVCPLINVTFFYVTPSVKRCWAPPKHKALRVNVGRAQLLKPWGRSDSRQRAPGVTMQHQAKPASPCLHTLCGQSGISSTTPLKISAQDDTGRQRLV